MGKLRTREVSVTRPRHAAQKKWSQGSHSGNWTLGPYLHLTDTSMEALHGASSLVQVGQAQAELFPEYSSPGHTDADQTKPRGYWSWPVPIHLSLYLHIQPIWSRKILWRRLNCSIPFLACFPHLPQTKASLPLQRDPRQKHKATHPLKVYISALCSVVTGLCDHHHCLIPAHFHHPQKKPCTH